MNTTHHPTTAPDPGHTPQKGHRVGDVVRRYARVGVLVFSLIILLCGIGSAVYYRAPGPNTQPYTLHLSPGTSLRKAALLLQQGGVVRHASHFVLISRLWGKNIPIRAGEYHIQAHASIADILKLLQSGTVVLHNVLVAPGMSSAQVYDRLMAETGLKGPLAIPEEGTILPESYAFTLGETRDAVVARMQKAMATTLAELWRKRSPGLPFKTPQEAVILASIVEKETSQKSELATVAGVYINRLRQGMRLQADPTVIYPLTYGRPLGRRIRLSELRAVNAYNTYTRQGLPAGPITNPGRQALKAVLHPEKNDYLFFVADGSGGHVFAKTADEHARNVVRWRQFRAQSGL